MTIRVYDSKAQALVDFTPLEPGKVGMYVCGPTVQSSPHIGHLRSALAYDLWRRWLSYRGFDVTFVRNVTDIDDKVLVNATEKEPWWAVAYRVELEFTRGYNALGILPPTYEPRATASIPGMQELITLLIEKQHAYVADDGSGDVFFAVSSWPSYGALTNQKPADMEASGDAETRGKRDPRDFALWKGTKSGEPASASWESPWGAGRPGWHIECSAMSRRYLGPAFDIHGGGLDLRFPHHENELAQSTAAGDAFASYWVHNGLVMVEGQKMSKSLGNFVTAGDFLSAAPSALAARYFLASAHYRSPIDYHEGSLEESDRALGRVDRYLDRAEELLMRAHLDFDPDEPVPPDFADAMDDDLNVPIALAVLHNAVRVGNAQMDFGLSDAVRTNASAVLNMVKVLGIHPSADGWLREQPDWFGLVQLARHSGALDAAMPFVLAARSDARAAKDYATADTIREVFLASGIAFNDGADGSTWEWVHSDDEDEDTDG